MPTIASAREGTAGSISDSNIGLSGVTAASAPSCAPEEFPTIAIRDGSISYSAASVQSHLKAALTSMTAAGNVNSLLRRYSMTAPANPRSAK